MFKSRIQRSSSYHFDLTKIITDKDEMILSFSKKFAHYLTINDVTLSISRKGEEAITIGKEAKPTLSKLLTRSDDVQIKSTMEAAKLTDDVTNGRIRLDQ